MIDERFHEGGNPLGKMIHEQQHVPEMHQIAIEEIEKNVPDIVRRECASLINEAVHAMIGAMHYDINTTLEIAFNDLNSMFTSSKARSFVSDTITQAITKQLQDIELKFKL